VTQQQRRLSDRLRGTLDVLVREAAKFGVVGLVAFVVDTTLYNYLVFGLPGGAGEGPLHDIPLRAKILATAIATVVAWLGNRYWTFRHRRQSRVAHEFGLFVLFNVLGLGIAVACLGFSRYVLGLDSQLADNIAANGVGLVLGTLFRFWAYRTYVFKGDALADVDVPLLTTGQEPPDPAPGAAQRAGAIET
jgi:putative flippase GtrA